MLKVLARIKSEPWAITPTYMETILEIAQRQNTSPEQVAKEVGRPLENTYDVEVRDGIAILSVNGPLFRYANLFSSISGATSYENLARDFDQALNDPDVRSIVLDIDSPGGESNGVSEFAEQIYQARGKKKIVAYVGGSGASAAYWIASAADEIVIDETAALGSIGTVLGVTDTRKRDEKEGVTRLEIVSTQSPYKRVDPMTDDGRARLQSWVDQLSSVFIGKVARNRGYSQDRVLSDFGQGDILIGRAAVDAGLADRLGSFEGVIEQLTGSAANQPRKGMTFQAPTSQPTSTADSETPTDSPAGKDQNEKESATMDLEKLKADHPDLYSQVREEGVKAGQQEERTRIQAIEDMAMKGHEELIAKAKFETGMSAEALAVELIKAEKAKGQTFLANRGKDAEELDDVDPGATDETDPQAAQNAAEEEKRNKLVAAAAKGYNARAGHKSK